MIRRILALFRRTAPKPESRTEAQMRADNWRGIFERYWEQRGGW